MNRVIVSFPKTCVRNFSATQILSTDSGTLKLQRLKKKVQALQLAEREGIPMYLRGGTKDKIVYYAAVFTTLLSVGLAFHSTYEYATKK